MYKDMKPSTELCEAVGLLVKVETRKSLVCDNMNCSVEPPALKFHCPTCEHNKALEELVEIPSVDFTIDFNKWQLIDVFRQMKISVTIDGGADKLWNIGEGDGMGNTLIEATNDYVNTLRECMEDTDHLDMCCECAKEFTEFKTLMNKQRWKMYY